MTHEELLAKFDDLDIAISNGFGKAETIIGCIKATRAVVELHRPSECSHGVGCLECGGMECATGYPCPTIQAIEKELGK